MPRRRLKKSVCPNCQTPLPAHANFCPNCGQENHSHTRPFGHLLYEFVESITHFDAKLWATLKAIVTKPGQFVVDFVNDRRARYVPPARLYVFVSVIFFLLVNKFVDKGLEGNSYHDQAADLYGVGSDYFSLNGLYGKLASAMKATSPQHQKAKAAFDAVNEFPIYYTPASDPTAAAAIRHLKQLGKPQLDSLLKAFYKPEEYRADKVAHFQEMLRLMPDRLPERYYAEKLSYTLVPVRRIVSSDRLDSLNLATLKDVHLPFDRNDSLGTQGLKKLQSASDAELLNIYRLSHPILPGDEKSVVANMRQMQKLLPPTHKIANGPATEELTLMGDMKPMRFAGDSAMKATLRQTKYMSDEQVLALIDRYSDESPETWSWWEKAFLVRSVRQTAKLNASTGYQKEGVKQLSHVMVKYVSWTMFLLMPIVAFLLLIIYYRRQKFYYEHLIFSVHVHTVFFLIFSLALLLYKLIDQDAILLFALGLGYLYLLLALKRTYAQGWPRTIVKFLLFTALYLFIFAIATTVISVLGFLNF